MESVQTFLAAHGGWALFALALVEGPLVVLAATALARIGTLDITFVWAVAVLADLAGDTILYLLGRFLPGLIPVRFRPSLAREQTCALFRQSGVRLLLFGKLTHVAGLPVLVAAGFGRMPLLPFSIWTLIGTVLKVSAIVLVGWTFWQALLSGDPGRAVAYLALLALALAVGALVLRARRWG